MRWLSLGAGMLYFAMTPILQARLVRVGPVSVVAVVGVLSLAALSFELAISGKPRVSSPFAWWGPVSLLCISLAIGMIRGPAYATSNSARFVIAFLLPTCLVTLMIGRSSRMFKIGLAVTMGLVAAAALQTYSEAVYGYLYTTEAYPSVSRALHASQDWSTGIELGVQNVFGCLAMAICAVACVAYAAEVRKSRHRWTAALLAVVLLIGQSRGGYGASSLVAAVGILAVLVWAGRRTGSARRTLVMVGILSLVVMGAIRLGYMNLYNLEGRAAAVAEHGLLVDPSIADRWEAMKLSVDVFLSSPLAGIGLQGWFFEKEPTIGGHSTLVDLPAQLGLIGFCAYYGLLLVGVKNAFAAYASTEVRDRRRPVAAAAGFATLSFILASMLDPVFLQPILNELSICLVALSVTLKMDLRRNSARLTAARNAHRRIGHVPLDPESPLCSS